MTGDFRSVVLSGRTVSRALPLVHTIWPDVDARAWDSYSQTFLTPARQTKAGIVAICDSSDYLCGVLIYEVQADLQDGQLLTMPLFVAADLRNSTELIGNLLDVARQTARDLDCAALQVHLSPQQRAVRSRLKTLGLADRAEYLWERVGPIRSPH